MKHSRRILVRIADIKKCFVAEGEWAMNDKITIVILHLVMGAFFVWLSTFLFSRQWGIEVLVHFGIGVIAGCSALRALLKYRLSDES